MFSHWILRLLLGWSARRYHGHRTWWVVLRPSCWKYLRPPCVSTFINKKRNFFLQEHWEQISFVTNFNILGFDQPFFSCWLQTVWKRMIELVSHSSLKRSWTTCVSGRSHVRCDLRKMWFPTLCHFSPAQVCFPLWSGYGHSVRPVGLPQSFPRVSRRIGRTYKHFVTVLDSFTKIPSPLQRKFALCNIFFR